MHLVVCMKWVPRRIVVDPVTATFELDERTFGPSAADAAALEVALLLTSDDDDDTVTVVCAGPPAADAMLHDALAAGATTAVRCPAASDAGSAAVAEALASMCTEADLVLCGDHSTDRGSGSVPGFLAAELDAVQVLGVIALQADGAVGLIAERRLDRGRRARVRAPFPAVVSVEGGVVVDGMVASPRRASVRAVLAANAATIEEGPAVSERGRLTVSAARPYRPRTKPRPVPPDAPAHVRILDITRATESRTPPKTLRLDPASAADATIEALKGWGYIADPGVDLQ